MKMQKRIVMMTVLDLETGAKHILTPLDGQSGADQRVGKSNGKGREEQHQERRPSLRHQEKNPHW
jgi:hypothetical protein